MEPHWQVEKPKFRSELRKRIGKEYFIAKRKWNWITSGHKWADQKADIRLPHQLIEHRSFLLRPLKNVEMYLQHNKVKNLSLAIAHIHQVVIEPGETFSIWKMVGRPTQKRGFLEGLTLNNGNIGVGIGGGLCQLGNLLYWMALHSPLEITERWRHGYDVFPDINRKIPFACGATLSYNYIDLQLKNNTDHRFQISLWLDAEYLNGSIQCDQDLHTTYDVFETDHHFRQQWWGGYTRHNKIWKKVTNTLTGEQEELLVAQNNAIMMYNPMLEGTSA
ncbi:MAG: VanW family protein [Bacteroidota bacterium]